MGSATWHRIRLPARLHAAQIVVEGQTLALLELGTHNGFAPVLAGRLWVSSDSGGSWSARMVPCRPADGGAAVLSIALDHSAAYLIDCYDDEQSSQQQDTQHHLYGSADGGLTWVRLGDPTHHGEPLLLADNGAGHAFLVTQGAVDGFDASFDGAQRWHRLFNDGGSFFGWADLRFLTAETGFLVGPTHYLAEHLYRTDNGGRTWRILPVRRLASHPVG